MKKLFVFFLFLFCTFGISENLFLSEPEITPDGEQIVFCYKSDLWIVKKSGGKAFRLTALEGREFSPSVSPDGKYLAFSSNSEGNNDVFVMPLNGGKIKKLTYNSNSDIVTSWSWDSKYIYFTSNRANNFTGYKVSINGGTPKRLLNGYFNTIHETVENPKDNSIYFTDTWESFNFRTRKKYKGDYNPDIKSYNLKTNEFRKLTSYNGKDFNPIFDSLGNLYFLSDRDNDEMNLFKMEKGRKVRLTNFNSSIRKISIDLKGKYIAFEKDYKIFVFDILNKKTSSINVIINDKEELNINKSFNVKGNITNFDVSDDGKKIAFVSRGLLFVSDIEGKFVKQLNTDKLERVSEVYWLKDSETLIYSRTLNGYYNWFKINAKNNGKEIVLTKENSNNRNMSFNSDKSMAVYYSGRNNLMLMDLKTYSHKSIVKDYFWGFYNSNPYFSPDDKYIVYTAYRNFEQDMFIYDLKKGKSLSVFETGVSESAPFWSPDGKYIYYSSDRVHPGFPRGTKNEKIYRVSLNKFDKPFKSDYFNKVFESEKKAEKKNNKKDKKNKDKKEKKEDKLSLNLQLEGIFDRVEQVSKGIGQQSSPIVFNEGEKSIIFYISTEKEGKPSLVKLTYEPFEKPKKEFIKGTHKSFRSFSNFKIIKKGKKYYTNIGNKIQKLNINKNSVSPIDISFSFEKNMKEEFKQMFYQVYANIEENFYDEKFHNVDWGKMKTVYEKYLPFVTNRNDLRTLLNDMLYELNASHMGFRTYGNDEKTFYSISTKTFGIIFNNENPYIVENILKNSPADKETINLKKGDLLVKVNGENVDFKSNREKYFSKANKIDEITLTFKRNEKEFDVKLHLESTFSLRTRLYDQWIDENQNMVDKLSNNEIAYIHMKDMGERSLEKFLIEMTSEAYKRKGLILDLRNNMGGNVHDDVLGFLSQKLYSYWKYRGDKLAKQPNFTPSSKPIVLLVNKLTLSDGEMTAVGFQALKLGKVVGTGTYRWLIFTTAMDLIDGSYHRMPSWGCYKVDGTDIEKNGVTPDVIVPLTIKDKHLGKDPQIGKAVEIIKQSLSK